MRKTHWNSVHRLCKCVLEPGDCKQLYKPPKFQFTHKLMMNSRHNCVQSQTWRLSKFNFRQYMYGITNLASYILLWKNDSCSSAWFIFVMYIFMITHTEAEYRLMLLFHKRLAISFFFLPLCSKSAILLYILLDIFESLSAEGRWSSRQWSWLRGGGQGWRTCPTASPRLFCPSATTPWSGTPSTCWRGPDLRVSVMNMEVHKKSYPWSGLKSYFRCFL